MSDKSPFIINIDMESEDWKCQIIENTVTSILFQVSDTTTRYVYKIHMREMRNQSETIAGGLKNLELKKECDLLVKNRTETDQAFALCEKHRGNIMLVEFFKYEGVPILCAACVLIVKPANLRITQVFLGDSTGKEVGCGSVQYEADLKFSLRMEYNRPLLRGEKVPKLKCKGYCTNAITGKYEEISKFQIDENAVYTDTIYCNDGLQESHAGADYVISLGFINPYKPPFYLENTNKLAPSIQKIHLISRQVRQPQIMSVVWSSKEMITFGESSPKRKSICYNEDGFLHIHTRGMYGQKVRIELFEKDIIGTKKLLLGLKDEVTILDNVVCVPVEMSGVHAKAKKGRTAWLEGSSFEIMAKVTPLDTSIAAFEQDDKSLIELKIYGKADEDKAAKSTVNGTMKFVIADVEEEGKEEKKGKDCGGKYCITKSNYKEKNAGKLIQEINIRLAGFGGNVPTEEFTDRTEACIKQFQRDYMKVKETGKICGSLLKAIDEFCNKWEESISNYKCLCHASDSPVKKTNRCPDFGKGGTNEKAGMHRTLLWAISGLKFYLDTQKEYKFDYFSACYRCNAHNAAKGRKSTNHMGYAADIHFKYNNGSTTMTGASKLHLTKLKDIRDKILIPYLDVEEGWSIPSKKNKFRIEPIGTGKDQSYSWIHIDVKLFESQYKEDVMFVKKQSKVKGNSIIDIATESGFNDLCKCRKK